MENTLKVTKSKMAAIRMTEIGKMVIIMYLIMIQSSVICLFVLASHEACDGHCVGFIEPSKNKMAAMYDLNGKF